jgi:hypothetical protein
MKRCRLILFLWLVAAALATARPARIILLRHAEKPADESRVHLSELGQARARALVGFFTNAPVLLTNGATAALFAPKFTRRGHSIRPYETLEPLGNCLRLPVQMPHGPADYAKLAKSILADPGLDGKTVVICWTHDGLADLAKALGVKPKPARWKGNVYDRVWIVTYNDHHALLTDLPQKLLQGDSVQ